MGYFDQFGNLLLQLGCIFYLLGGLLRLQVSVERRDDVAVNLNGSKTWLDTSNENRTS